MKYLPRELCEEGKWMAAMDDIDFIRSKYSAHVYLDYPILTICVSFSLRVRP